MHVLIIEDEPIIAMDIQIMLEDEGVVSFDVAVTEFDAIHCALANPPDLITSDVRLSIGSGPRAVSAILAKLGPIPVIFITGSPSECTSCEEPAIILTKPLAGGMLGEAFRQLT